MLVLFLLFKPTYACARESSHYCMIVQWHHITKKNEDQIAKKTAVHKNI